MLEKITIEKLINGGQGLGVLPDGRKVFVWNALPGEKVSVRIIKSKKDYAEAIAEEIHISSPERIEPRESNYLSTSPWQILKIKAENNYKNKIVQEIFDREHISLPLYDFVAVGSEWRYRNKMEYSFWGDEQGLHLALHRRGSKGKQIVHGSELAMRAVDVAARALLAELQKLDIRAGDLKAMIVRCSQKGEAVASLFSKMNNFEKFALPKELKGLRVYYSNPKSPASVQTKLLYEEGDCILTDTLLGTELIYDVDSFFQVNLPVFEYTTSRIKKFIGDSSVVDMYGGVGSIGLSTSAKSVTIVELDEASAAMARQNASKYAASVVWASSEKALDTIQQDRILIVDPPRAGLHKDVVARILTVQPKKVVYLSCNPVTQARDIAMMADNYELVFFEGYNYFPHTPHIETLAILQRNSNA